MNFQKAAIRKAVCSRTNLGLHNLVRVPSTLHDAEYRTDSAEERVGIRSSFSGRFRPSVPLVYKYSRDKDFAVWCSCCQSAACPLRLRAKPLWVLSDESDSLVPYFMQDFLLIRILAPCALFMCKCRNFSGGRLLCRLKRRERNAGPRMACLDSNMTSETCKTIWVWMFGLHSCVIPWLSCCEHQSPWRWPLVGW